MRLGMELEFDKYCVVDGSPTTVLPLPRQHSKVERRRSKGHNRHPNDVLSLKEEATIRNFQRYRSVSCNTNSLRKVPQEHDEMHKRGSVYQSSKEVRLMRKTEATQGRKKIEIPGDSDTDTLSFEIVDSLCSSDEDKSRGEQRRYSVVSLNSDLSTETTCKSHMEINSQDLLDLSSCPIQSIPRRNIPLPRVKRISCDTDGVRNRGAKEGEFQPVKNMNGAGKPVKVGSNDVRVHSENNLAVSLPKSLSAKLTLPHSPARSESESSRASSPRGRFGQVRKVLDPFIKSKLQKSPMSSSSEQQSDTPSSGTSLSWNKTFRKSLLHDFSNIRQPAQSDESPAKEYCHQPVLNSPAHLQGLLKLDQKHGVPFFEFSVKVTEDLYIARTWKEESSLDWMYTFHSAHDLRKSNASGRGSKDGHKVSSLVGQMQVSCYLCTELKDAGASDNSMVSEFVMHDVSNLRKSISSQDNSSSCLGVAKTLKASDENSAQAIRSMDEVCFQEKGQQRRARHSGRADSLTGRPLAAVDMLAHSEAAAIVVQVPFERRESLKFNNGEGNIFESVPSLLGDLNVQSNREHFADCSIAIVNAVIPCGTHSLPTTESQGPSSLLDRWRLGGGCDCGGWDLACPLNVLGNSNIKMAKDHILMENNQTWNLFIQGRKDNTPALRMTRTEEGQYAVDFHAQLSTLQAFSICVAVLHATDTSLGFSHEQRSCLLQRNSLEAFTKLEIENLVDAVAATKKTRVSKNTKRSLPSFIVNPPFSPIARV